MKRKTPLKTCQGMRRTVFKKKRRLRRDRKGATLSERISLLRDKCQAMWSKVVRARDKHVCSLCGSGQNLQAHHWIVHSQKCLATRYLVDNGITLCEGCHYFKVHMEGSAETFDKIRDFMNLYINQDRYEEIKRLGHTTSRWGLGDYEKILASLTVDLEAYA